MRDIYKVFKDNIQNLLPAIDGLIILGLSAGLDSVCLFDMFLKYLEEFPGEFSLISHHQNHLIRDEAEKDLELARKVSEENGIEFYYSVDDVPKLSSQNSRNEEDMGREVRYKNWLKLVDKFSSDYSDIRVATAHHANDQAETVLLNLSRGSSLKGLAGIERKRDIFIRPLLNITKNELYEYAKTNELEWNEDYTNFDSDHRRNFLRNVIIPEWEGNTDDGLVNRIANTASILADVNSFFEDYLEKIRLDLVIEGNIDFYNPKYNYYDLKKYHDVDDRLKKSLIAHILKSEKLLKDVFAVHIENIYDLLNENRGEKSVDLPFEYVLTKNRKFFYLYQGEYISNELSAKINPVNLLELIETNSNSYIKYIEDEGVMNNADFLVKQVDIQDIEIRNFKTGDYLIRKDGKKVLLKEYFSEKLLRLELRDTIILLAKNSEVLSIGKRIINNKFLLNSENADILNSDSVRMEYNAFIWYNFSEKTL